MTRKQNPTEQKKDARRYQSEASKLELNSYNDSLPRRKSEPEPEDAPESGTLALKTLEGLPGMAKWARHDEVVGQQSARAAFLNAQHPSGLGNRNVKSFRV